MSRRFFAGLGLLAAVTGAPAAGQAPPAAAKTAAAPKTWTAPRTPWGHPDLQGVWANNSATPLERPKELAGKEFLSPEEVATLQARAARIFEGGGDAAFGDSIFQTALVNGEGFRSRDGQTGSYNQFWMVDRDFDNRTSLIVDPPDGRMPRLTPEAEKRRAALAAIRQRLPEGPEDRSLAERCLSFGVPRLGAGYNSYYHILQTPQYVAIQMETIHDVRVIPLDGRPHVPPTIRQLHGDSRGRWEGNTLVVETTNFSSLSNYYGSAENLHVVERFTRAGPGTIEYEVTAQDPSTWTRSWTVRIPLRLSPDPIFEFACHEGNIGMVGMLAGARAQERAAASAARRSAP